MMQRRAFVAGMAAVMVAPPPSANAVSKISRIGFLHSGSPAATADRAYVEVFREEMRNRGYIEGENLAIEYRWAEGFDERLPRLAAELVGREVRLIVAANNPAIIAAKEASGTIPVVTAVAVDPIGQGFIASFAKPGRNITGATYTHAFEVAGKNVELLKEAIPSLSRLAGLIDASLPAIAGYRHAAADTAKRLGLSFSSLEFRRVSEVEAILTTMLRQGAEAVYVFGSPITNRYRREIIQLTARYRLPDTYVFREGADSGGLMSYGVNISDLYRRAAVYVVRILAGARPNDLPVEQPTKFELVINLNTAKSLGITIPQSLLLRADEVIQ